jgi:hypothetical protein
MSIAPAREWLVRESSSLASVQTLDTVSHTGPTVSYTDDISAGTRKIVNSFLLAGVLFLGIVGAYVWYGFTQWQNIP